MAVFTLVHEPEGEITLVELRVHCRKHTIEPRAVCYVCFPSKCVAGAKVDTLLSSRRQFAVLHEIATAMHNHTASKWFNEAGIRVLSFGSLEWRFIIEAVMRSDVVDVCG